MRAAASRALLPWCALALAGAACGLLKKPTPPAPALPPITITAPVEAKAKASMVLTASADVNPDRNGRPSPVLVRVYQLKADGAFKSSQFEPLFDDDKKVLADAFGTRDEFTLSPGQKQVIEVVLADSTRFVGVVAAFRDIANAEWRGVAEMPRDKESQKIVLRNLNVTVSGKRVDVRAE
jgi:type VI secretion system protein VasD